MVILSFKSCDLLSEAIRIKNSLTDVASGLWSSAGSLLAQRDDGFGVGDEVGFESKFGGSVEERDRK